MIKNLPQAAIGYWKSILSGIIGAEYLTGKHGPCPLCEKNGDGGKDRFRFDDKNGTGTYYCSHCGAGQGIRLLALHQGMTHAQAWMLVEKLLPDAQPTSIKSASNYSGLIQRLLRESEPVLNGSEVANYLHGRGILEVPPTIRQVKYADFSDPAKSVYDAMLCRMEKNGQLAGLHLTLLKDGQKAPIQSPRRFLKVSDGLLSGAAIRLYPYTAGFPLIVGEGVETSLWARQLWGNGEHGCWAAGNSTLLEQLEVPEGAGIIVAGDNDLKFGGQAAAFNLGHRLAVKHKYVEVRIPQTPGTDWADFSVGS